MAGLADDAAVQRMQTAIVATINTVGVTIVGPSFQLVESSPIPDDEIARILLLTAGFEP